MTDADHSGENAISRPTVVAGRKNEGWRGIAITAVLCGAFLWWWFQPERADVRTERNPRHWLEFARREAGGPTPTPEIAFEIVMIAEAFRAQGESAGADELETTWLPAEWRDDGASPAATPPPPDAPFDAIGAGLAAAVVEVDQLEIERGQAMLREVAEQASSLSPPTRTSALWWVASRQARCGFTDDAAATRSRIAAGAVEPALPIWLLAEMLQAEIVQPVVSRLRGRPPGDAEAVAVARLWRSVARDRATQAEQGRLARDGPEADASSPGDATAAASRRAIRQAVEAGELRRAGDLARQATRGDERARAFLVIARCLAWHGTAAGPAVVRGVGGSRVD